MRLLILLFVPLTAFAICPPDLTGTQPTDKFSEYNLASTTPCPNCREINQYPQDMINAAWNYIMTGNAADVYDREYGIGSIGTKVGPESKFNVRVKNNLGQAVTVTIVTEFNTLDVTAVVLSMRTRTSIKGWRLQVVLTSGYVKNKPIDWREGLESTAFRIPAGDGDDGVTPGEDCLNNDGEVRPPRIRDGSGGSSGEPSVGLPGGGSGQCEGPCK